MPYTVLIVDDETLARQVIQNYLKAYPDFVLIGQCDNGKDAVQFINDHHPDVVFLDVQMPELTGIEVVERLVRVPHIIFSTAYDEYAIRAFEINAVDYLLKPYDESRFRKSVIRVRNQLQLDRPNVKQLADLLEAFQKPQAYIERLLIPQKDQLVFVHVKDILYIEAVENYVSMITQSGSYLIFQKISELEAKLNPRDFFRIHRSFIVNVNYVKAVENWKKSSYRVVLTNGNDLPLSRRRVRAFKMVFGV